MDFRYCPLCGRQLSSRQMGDEGEVPFCEACNRPFFGFSYPCVIVTVLNDQNEIALIRQNRVTTVNWVLVAGYIKPGETAEDCVAREVFEETGLSTLHCDYLSSFYHQKGDHLMLAYVAYVAKADFARSQEVDDVAWFSLKDAGDKLRPGSIAEKVYFETCRRNRNSARENT